MTEATGRDVPRPFFETEPTTTRGRLLLISYHFPPGQATGALRWQKFARYAAERGWGLDVVTLDPADLRTPEMDRLKELPSGVRVFGVRQPPPPLADRILDTVWGVYRKLRNRQPQVDTETSDQSIPANGARPSDIGREEIRWLPFRTRNLIRAYHACAAFAREGRWARDAAALAIRNARTGLAPSAVISCGPPHMVHEAGRRAARALAIPLIMDLRDPWSLTPRLPESTASPLWYQLAHRYETRAIAQSTLVVANTEAVRQAMQVRFPESAARIIAVMNGFDDEPTPASLPNHRFLMAYAGVIYAGRNPRTLFQATARVIHELQLGPEDIGIEFMGQVSEFNGVSLEAIAAEEGLTGFVRLFPPAPRKEALEFLSGATMLVNLPQEIDMSIPSKIFDYMRFNAWLLVLANQGSAPDLLLRGTTADLIVPDDIERIAAILRKRYLQHVAGQRPPRIADQAPHCSREAQAASLFDAIEQHIGRPHGVRPAPVVRRAG
jgi:glycosyltransferase involved in cell wall biosynthesis